MLTTKMNTAKKKGDCIGIANFAHSLSLFSCQKTCERERERAVRESEVSYLREMRCGDEVDLFFLLVAYSLFCQDLWHFGIPFVYLQGFFFRAAVAIFTAAAAAPAQ